MIRDRRSDAALTRGRPSARAELRLREALRRDVADTRTRLHEAQLRGDALIEAGMPDEAALVADEQRALVAALRVRVEDVVAAAAVEREAEWVVGGTAATVASPAPPVAPERPPRHPVARPEPVARTGSAPGGRPRHPVAAAAGAILAAVVAAAAFLVAIPDDAGRTLAGAGGSTPPDADGRVEPTAGGLTADPATFGTGAAALGPASVSSAPITAVGSDGVDGLGLWFGHGPDGTLADPPRTVTLLPDMDDVIHRVLASAALEAPSVTAPAADGIEDPATRDGQPGEVTATGDGPAVDGDASPPRSEEPAPAGEATTEPTPGPTSEPSEQPAGDEEPTGGDGDDGGEGGSTAPDGGSDLSTGLDPIDVADGLGS